MVKKGQNPLKIDFKRGIIEDSLLQIRNLKISDKPELVKVWTIEIHSKDTQLVLSFIKEQYFEYDPITYSHCKRIQKSSSQNKLIIILCSIKLFSEAEEVSKHLHKAGFAYDKLSLYDLPISGPSTKEVLNIWNKSYWPLVWRGNPNDQILNDYRFDMPYIKQIIARLECISVGIKESKCGGFPIVTAFVNPCDVDNPYFQIDTRHQDDLLSHSIMQGIFQVAAMEAQRRDNVKHGLESARNDTYLCLDFDIYTTHEPCSMCAMALIHSRVKRCIFINAMENTGALKHDSGDGYCMHDNKELNSKYEVFQWISSKINIPVVKSDICC